MRKTIFVLVILITGILVAGSLLSVGIAQEEVTAGTEKYCTAKTGEKLSLSEAKQIALNSECVQDGALGEKYFCNEDTGTWWIDLNIQKEMCHPACVINIATKTAKINRRCMGLLPPH